MAPRKNSKEVIDFTSYIPKNKTYTKTELDNYSKELISLLLNEDFTNERIKELFGIFLSSFVSSISFDIKNKKTDKYLIINLFTSFILSKYKDFSILIKCIDNLF